MIAVDYGAISSMRVAGQSANAPIDTQLTQNKAHHAMADKFLLAGRAVIGGQTGKMDVIWHTNAKIAGILKVEDSYFWY